MHLSVCIYWNTLRTDTVIRQFGYIYLSSIKTVLFNALETTIKDNLFSINIRLSLVVFIKPLFEHIVTNLLYIVT